MRHVTSFALIFGFVASVAGAQAPPAPPAPPAQPSPQARPAPVPWPPDALIDLDGLGPALRSLDRLREIDLTSAGMGERSLDVDAILGDVDAAMQAAERKAVVVARDGQVWTLGENADYDRGTALLDSGRYDRAIEAFDKVIAKKGPKADGAMYWKAYALNRLGKRTEALAVIDDLVKNHPQSRWLGDAKALEFDVQRAAGQPVKPDQASDEDLKLIALNSLVASDPDRGIPMVEQILKGSASPRMKERALFVLAQSASPKAKALLADVARGKGNPDLQMKALDYLGAFRGGPDVALLLDVYRSTNDPDVKRRVIRSLGMAGRERFAFSFGTGDDAVFEWTAQSREAMEEARAALERARADLEKNRADLEKNRAESQRDRVRVEIDRARTELDRGAARNAAREKEREARAKEAGDALWQLYQSEKSLDLRREILRNLRFSSQADHLLQIARTDPDAKLRQAAVQGLAMDRTPQSVEMMLTLYRNEKDPTVRRQIIDAVAAMRGSAGTLVQMARTETDPALRKRIVERLSTMKDKEATDYMMEILKK